MKGDSTTVMLLISENQMTRILSQVKDYIQAAIEHGASHFTIEIEADEADTAPFSDPRPLVRIHYTEESDGIF